MKNFQSCGKSEGQLSDYRSLSPLLVLPKIYEKFFLKEIVESIENHELYKPTQSAFEGSTLLQH